MTDKDKIKSEIVRRRKIVKNSALQMKDAEKRNHYLKMVEEYDDILRYIDTSPSEPVSEDLEEAAREYGDELDNVLAVCIDDDNTVGEYAQEAFKAGAQWQKDRTTKKAEVWLENNLQGIVGGSIYMEDFKEYMKERKED